MPGLALRLAWAGVLFLALPRMSGYSVVITKAIQSSTIAEIHVDEGRVTVEAESTPGDPELWSQLVVAPGAGKPVPARLIEKSGRQRVPRDEITGQPLAGEKGTPVSFARFEYPITGRPKTLRLAGPRIGFIVYHLGLPVTDLHYLEGGQILDLDWRDPWNSRFRNEKLSRQYDARVSVFLYVEPHEVRAEVVLRPADVERRIGRVIPASEQARLQSSIAELLSRHLVLQLDGARVEPVLDRSHFLRRTLYTSTVIDPPEDLPASSATLGVIFVAPTSGYPREASLTWDLFSPVIRQVAASVTDPVGPKLAMLRPRQNRIEWKNLLKDVPATVPLAPPPGPLSRYLPVPGALAVLALLALAWKLARTMRTGKRPSREALIAGFVLLAIAGGCFSLVKPSTVDDKQAGEILFGLLSNVYRAFDFRDERTVYDLLARSVSGDLLREIYLETRRALEVRSQGGARARVRGVEVVRSEANALRTGTGFDVRCVWNVAASVSHWGHIHERRNQYEALLTVQAVDGAWKITAMELVSEARL